MKRKSGKIEVLPIDTTEQIADIFTKALDKQTFEYLRHKLIGWQLQLERECEVTTSNKSQF